VLGEETKLDAMTDREIKVAVVTKADAEFKADGRSDEYLDGRFVGALQTGSAPATTRRDEVAAKLDEQQKGKPGNGETRIDSAEAARKAALRAIAEASQQPLRSVSQR